MKFVSIFSFPAIKLFKLKALMFCFSPLLLRFPKISRQESGVPRKTENHLITENAVKRRKTPKNTEKKKKKNPPKNAGKRLENCIYKTEDTVFGKRWNCQHL